MGVQVFPWSIDKRIFTFPKPFLIDLYLHYMHIITYFVCKKVYLGVFAGFLVEIHRWLTDAPNIPVI